MSDDLVQFLRDRYDEEAADARAAKPGPWHADGGSVYATHPVDEVVDYTESADHIARQDPARTLRRIEAERLLLKRYDEPETDPRLPRSLNKLTASVQRQVLAEVFRVLALPYAGHPDYRDEWRP